jgi:hypothetical protein
MTLLRYFALVLICLLAILGIKKIPDNVIVRAINCENQYGTCSQKLTETINDNIGLSLTETKQNLISYFNQSLQVDQYSFQYIIPDKLMVHVVEAKSVFAIKANGNLYLADSNNYVISSVESSSLPTLTIDGDPPEIGSVLTGEVGFAGELLYTIYYSNQVTNAYLKDDGIYLNVNGIEVIFPKSGDIRVLAGSLNAILSKLRSDYENFKIEKNEVNCTCYVLNECRNSCTIDLRFKNPVIR